MMRPIDLLDSYEKVCDKSLVSSPDYSDSQYSLVLRAFLMQIWVFLCAAIIC